jgi:hypothetical protein
MTRLNSNSKQNAITAVGSKQTDIASIPYNGNNEKSNQNTKSKSPSKTIPNNSVMP